MSTLGKRTIYVGAAGENNSKPQVLEGVANAVILPGTLVAQSVTGFAASTATSKTFGVELLFADKDQVRGKSVDDAWTVNENMVAIKARSGDFLNVLVATGQTLAAGDALVSNGDGTLKKATDLVSDGTDGVENVLAYADETITTTAAELVRVRIA